MQQRNTKNYDIIIIGGGMVGATLACALKGLPLKIAVIEALPPKTRLQADFDARSISLAYGSQRILETLGLWQALCEYAVPIYDVHVSDHGRFGVTRMQASQAGLPALGYVVEVQYLNHVLYQACMTAANIDYISPAKVSDVTLTAETALLKLDTEQGEQQLAAKLCIAADGGNSFIRNVLKLKTLNWDYGQSALVANIGLARDHQHKAYERFTATGPMAMLPLQDKRAALIWAHDNDKIKHYLELSDAEFLQALQQKFGYRLGRFVKVGKRASFPLKLIVAREPVQNRLVLLGNAAHNLHPIAGQGFNLGLRDLASLAEMIASAAKQQLDIGHMSILKQYQQQRLWDQREIIGLSDFLARLFTNDYFPLTWLRDASKVAVDTINPIKHFLVNHTSGMAGRLPKLACGIDL